MFADYSSEPKKKKRKPKTDVGSVDSEIDLCFLAFYSEIQQRAITRSEE